MKKALFGWLTVLLVSCSAPLLAHAGNDSHRHGGLMKAVGELDLSKDQKKKLEEIRVKFKDTVSPKRKAMETAHEELQSALQGSAADDEVKKKFEALHDAADAFMRARFDKVMAIRAILTQEQRAKFKALRGPGESHETE